MKLTTALRSKKSRKKKPGGKNKVVAEAGKTNGAKDDVADTQEEEDDVEPDTEVPTENGHSEHEAEQPSRSRAQSIVLNGVPKSIAQVPNEEPRTEEAPATPRSPTLTRSRKPTISAPTMSVQSQKSEDTEARFEALAQERTALRDEVAQMRRSLEEIQEKHKEELSNVREELEDSQAQKEHAETQYRNLLGRVEKIKSQLGERLKADAVSDTSDSDV